MSPGLPPQDPFRRWFDGLERRHLATLTFPELRRALTALSQAYVERRATGLSRALDSAGKRAAYALFYTPLHFLVVRSIVDALGAEARSVRRILDLGAGTGAAGAAWALRCVPPAAVQAVDLNPWALEEARLSWRVFGLEGHTQRADLLAAPPPGRGTGIVLGWVVNELDDAARDILLDRLLGLARDATRVLVVEPIARRPLPWWESWAGRFLAAGGRADEWRFPALLPERLRLLDRAAGLDHRELTARSLWR